MLNRVENLRVLTIISAGLEKLLIHIAESASASMPDMLLQISSVLNF